MAELLWKKFLRFLINRKSLPVDLTFEFRQIAQLDWEQKVRPLEGVNCFYSGIGFRLTMNGIADVKADLWTCDIGTL